MQIVELHYCQHTTFDFAAIKARASAILKSDLDSPNPRDASKVFLLFHKQHTVKYSDGSIPAQTAIFANDEPLKIESYAQVIQQSWRCRGAADILNRSQNFCSVTEMMAQALDPKDRLMLFHGVLQAAIEITNPDALVFRHAEQVVFPADYLKDSSKDPIFRPGSLNVRFYNIANAKGEMLMDTRGLEEIGLHDLQCHFRDLDPNGVSRVLFNTAVYIAENGPIIESGQTVAGIDPGSKWRCQFENSLIDPKREVLDLDPGFPYAAGNRRMTS